MKSQTAQRLVFLGLYACPATDGDFVAIFLTVNFPLITPGTPGLLLKRLHVESPSGQALFFAQFLASELLLAAHPHRSS
jgi:hypothetical protein